MPQRFNGIHDLHSGDTTAGHWDVVVTTPVPRRIERAPGWDGADEFVETLCSGPGVVVERILSRGHTTSWCDQDHDEWVMVHVGQARLEFDGGQQVTLGSGDHLLLPAHCRHRVVWTDPEQVTVWVAVHHEPGGGLPRA